MREKDIGVQAVYTHLIPKYCSYLSSNTLGYRSRSYTTRLGTTYPTPVSKPVFCKVLDHLSSLAGTGITNNDEYLMLDRTSVSPKHRSWVLEERDVRL